MFHSARWDYEYTGGSEASPVLGKLADKRVAIVGTGEAASRRFPTLAAMPSSSTFFNAHLPPSMSAPILPPTRSG
jgi:cyclohexanone monooxygenase